MMPTRLTLLLALAAFSTVVDAASAEVILDVKGMTCSTCPITLRAVLRKLGGVEDVVVDAKRHTAAVRFDEAKVSRERIEKAATEAGFPAVARQ